MKRKVLFICVHNAARSQMAEAFLKKYGGDRFLAESAGFEPTSINPQVIEVMKEEGIDLSQKKTQSVFSLVQNQVFFGTVITVCDRGREKDCPIFPGVPLRLHWDFENPEEFKGTKEETMEQVRALKEEIKAKILAFINET